MRIDYGGLWLIVLFLIGILGLLLVGGDFFLALAVVSGTLLFIRILTSKVFEDFIIHLTSRLWRE